MYNHNYKRCCCQNNFDDSMIETACANLETITQYNSSNNSSSCNCGFNEPESVFPSNPMFGQSYVPIQRMSKTFVPSIGLKIGTIFPELVNPYKPYQSIEEIAFIETLNTIKEGCNRC